MKPAERLLVEMAMAHEDAKAAQKKYYTAEYNAEQQHEYTADAEKAVRCLRASMISASNRLGVCRRACMLEGKRLVRESRS
jgi:hypothetical protein